MEMTVADRVLVAVRKIVNSREYRKLIEIGEKSARRYWALVRVVEDGKQSTLKFGPFPTPHSSVCYRKKLVARLILKLPDVIAPTERTMKVSLTSYANINYNKTIAPWANKWKSSKHPDNNYVARAAKERCVNINRDN